ncbi:BatA domain-containing protein [Humisphaera borealis]|uniref:BatA domain-containing protein n=1 Tax=Humisphaera borealis TaxID=2807512 RepID=A0A7M2WVZ6_9BACT|nr:BatA domain-containing protein [Humisphaera borealis]QOV89698.1 BatA domain-containing protein [Humisphaera borealis]
MSGLTFLFSAALWALPLAGLPVLLHLLFRRKSQVVPFPTLRFVRASMQQTAARKKIRRWLLLLLRAVALLALIWAVAQPALMPSDVWASRGGNSAAAVIVVDTSYSMQLAADGSTLAGRADRTVRELLAGQLRGMKVAILRSQAAPADLADTTELQSQETFRDAATIQWSAPPPQPAVTPLADRVELAARLLAQQPVDDRWLIVVSDFQNREFPRAIPEPNGVRMVLIDLHPDDVRSASIASVRLNPEQPTPGLISEAVIDVAGRPRDARQVNVVSRSLDLEGGATHPPAPANLDDGGRARLRIPLAIPPAGFVAVEASLTSEQPLPWARSRRLLLQVPPRQNTAILDSPGMDDVTRRIELAMDPGGGRADAWPLSVRRASGLPADANVAVAVISDWPSVERARQLRDFAAAGNTVILFLRPGLEASWADLPQPQRDALSAILPGVPTAALLRSSTYTAAIASPADPVLDGLTDERFQIGGITARRLLPFDVLSPGAQPILNVADAATGGAGARPAGLLFRRSISGNASQAGTVFTFATLPDKRYSTLHLHPTFPPMLVQMALRPPTQSDATNVELGTPLTLSDARYLKYPELRLEGPGGTTTNVRPTTQDGRKVFRADPSDIAGLYTWRNPADDRAVAMANVQYPAAEADLSYTPAGKLLATGSSAVVVRSLGELADKFSALSQPVPQWQLPLAIVMALLCVEAFVGSAPRG